MRAMSLALLAIVAVIGSTLSRSPLAATASAQPSCSAARIVRSGSVRLIESPVNGGYTRFVSDGGGTYGIDPNSIPEQLSNLTKPNGPPVTITVAGRVCAGKIFSFERILKPIATPLRTYTPGGN
jgi:hypothetical protein